MLLSGALILLGLVLIVVEFFVPGIVMGVLGGALFLSGVGWFALVSPSIWLTVLTVVGSLSLLAVLIRIAVLRLRKATAIGLCLDTDQADHRGAFYSEELIGCSGRVVTDLKPCGYVIVAGNRQQAISSEGYLERDCPVVVTGGKGAYLIVARGGE